jgi:quercetin dioxygenase-like cupin family protein
METMTMNATNPNRFIQSGDVKHLDLPWCHLEELSTAETVGAERLFMVRATMPAGEGHNFHCHPGREEILYVLEGEAEQWVGTESRRLRPGDVAFIPGGSPHATFNHGPGTLRFLAILSPVQTNGPFTIDVYDEEPWKAARPAVAHAGYVPSKGSH